MVRIYLSSPIQVATKNMKNNLEREGFDGSSFVELKMTDAKSALMSQNEQLVYITAMPRVLCKTSEIMKQITSTITQSNIESSANPKMAFSS